MNLERNEAKRPFLYWKAILKEWITLNKQIFNCAKGEFAAYSYGERPNIGVMAGAAVKAGWVALEECWSEKTGILGAKKPYDGRADLWLWQNPHHEKIEAKLTSDGFSELKRKIPLRRASAVKDAGKLGKSPDSTNMALTFIVPRVERTQKGDFETSVVELADYCLDLSPSIFGSVFPGRVPRLGGDRKNDQKDALGVIVIGDVVG